MINTKRIITKCAATVTCLAMFVGSTLAGYAAESVAIDTSTATPNSYYGGYTQGNERWYAMWKDTSSIQINAQALPPSYSVKADITEESEVTVDGKKAKFISKRTEEGETYYIFGLVESTSSSDTSTKTAASTEIPKASAPVTPEQKYYNNMAEKENEILLAAKGKSLTGTKHIEYREGDSISSDMMETLSKTSDVVLDFYFTYKGKHYLAKITSEDAKNVISKKIEWAGPEYIKENFNYETLD